MTKITIAIDGFSSTGKSTLAKALATELQYAYIDTGAMYRAMTLFALNQGWLTEDGTMDKVAFEKGMESADLSFCFDPEKACSEIHLNGKSVESEIRGMRISSLVSKVSQIPALRRFLVQKQQEMGAAKGVVLDGRDIGTVVFPDAELKIFMTASPEVRAQRRFDELKAKGQEASFEEVLENLKQRDHDDMNREESPLIQAADAKILDNSDISKDKQFDLVLSWALDKINAKA